MLKQLLATFLFCSLIGAITVQAQFVVVNSPMDIAGVKSFDAGGFGTDISTGIWTSDVVLADDGVAPTSEGCTTFVNAADVAGKIVLIDRGDCEFGLKCLNAQNAGAIAVVVFNNVPNDGTFIMGAGADGSMVNLPCVMLNYEDGQLIKDALAMGPVNMTIGNIMLTNIVGLDATDVNNYVTGVMPVSQLELLLTPFTPAASIRNQGTDSLVTGATLNCSIDFDSQLGGSAGSNVYSESDVAASFDTSAVITLPDYIPAEGTGTYNVTYSVSSDSTEENFLDDTWSTSFSISDSIYSRSRWNFTTNRPRLTGGTVFTVGGGGQVEFLMGIRVPNGVGLMFDKVSFYAQTDGSINMEDIDLNDFGANVYEWRDANSDGNVTADEVVHVGYGLAEEYDDPTSSFNWFNIQILNIEDNSFSVGYPIPDTNKQYFVGANYRGSNQVFFGFDLDYDQTFFIDNLIASDLDWPYLQGSDYEADDLKLDFGQIGRLQGLNGAISMGITMVPFVSSVGEINSEIGSFDIYPNPVTDYVNVEANLSKIYKTVDYTIVTSNGTIVSTVTRDIQGSVDNATLDVSDLPAGQYFLHLNTEDGGINKAFTVQR